MCPKGKKKKKITFLECLTCLDKHIEDIRIETNTSFSVVNNKFPIQINKKRYVRILD